MTNTVPVSDDKRFDNLQVLSIAPLMADAIEAVFEDRSRQRALRRRQRLVPGGSSVRVGAACRFGGSDVPPLARGLLAMPDTKLAAEVRTDKGSRPAGRLRRDGRLPGVVYGLGDDAISVTVSAKQLGGILSSRTGANTLITLQIDGRDQLALARQVQRDAVKGTLLHVDFVRVRADQTIQAEVRLSLLGQPEGVSQGGMLEQLMHSLTVEGLPGQLPTEIEHDVTGLVLGDQLHVSDVQLPAGVVITNDATELIAMISVPRGLAEGEGEVAAEAAEGAEGEEGAAAAPAEEAAAQE